ncbi:MAG: ferric reductase-like transmembrane domain-containing protein [Candidatus Magasanikbacteria bacterium]
MFKKKETIYGVVTLCLVIIFSLVFFNTTKAQTTSSIYAQDPDPKDTDIDGLTDQGEKYLFGTDPTLPDTDADGYLDGAEVLSQTDPLDPMSPGTVAQVKTIREVPWPWYSARAAGIISYILLFFITISGIALSTGALYRVFGQVWGWRMHQWIGIMMMVSVVGHVVALGLDTFMSFSLAELLIPFATDYKPVLMASGIVSFYFFLILISTSLFVIQKKYRLWRYFHYLSFPMFAGAFVHSVLLGTDSKTLTMTIMYWATAIIVGLFVIYRILYRKIQGRVFHQHLGHVTHNT